MASGPPTSFGAEFSSALDVAHLSMALAARHERVEALTWADWLTGATLWELGALIDARRHLQSALDLCAAAQASTASPPGWDGHVLTQTYLARALWPLGYPEQAVIANERALTRARSLRQPMSVAAALWTETILKLWEADPEQASTGADRLLAHCTEYGIGHYAPLARFGKGTFLARFGNARQAIDVLRAVVGKSNMWSFSAALPRSLAIAHARLGQPDLGLQFLDEAMQRIEKSEGRNPRIRCTEAPRRDAPVAGQRRRSRDRVGACVHGCVQSGCALVGAARCYGVSSAVCYCGKYQEAQLLLAPVYNSFIEGLEVPGVKAAKELLDELGQWRAHPAGAAARPAGRACGGGSADPRHQQDAC